jgi:hypothetical protein
VMDLVGSTACLLGAGVTQDQGVNQA